ncbi:uncharacterized protein LOC127260508 [Andrographis paniculata]|uniref:uncharacterized protein LOC127260508 n=1 Tax=Andrographis paniculata TaxID=175694 RepID=UPI0021E99C48|nr:uncharacterized protein LOC127260508 [Andrographis paniculata]
MAVPSVPHQILRRFVPRFAGYPLLSLSPSPLQAQRFLPFLHSAALSSTYSGRLRLVASPPRCFSRLVSDEVALIEDVAVESEIETNGAAAADEKEGLSRLDFGGNRTAASRLPSLSVKEKKELASYAHSLGKKLKSQQVGKSGVTDTVVMALSETLEANELLKLKIHGNCPGEFDDVVNQLEQSTGSVVVGQIGRTVILYRPSLSKLKAAEKRKIAIKAHSERRLIRKQSPQGKTRVSASGQESSQQRGRGRRGSSRV